MSVSIIETNDGHIFSQITLSVCNFFPNINKILKFPLQLTDTPNTNFYKIISLGVALINADGRTDTDTTSSTAVVLNCFSKWPIKGKMTDIWRRK
jgi:uncharacterized protein YlxP (DUF503 family)